LTKLKTCCADELGFDVPTEQVPFEFEPSHTAVVILFNQWVTEKRITATENGGYLSGDVEKVVVSLLNSLGETTQSSDNHQAKAATLTEQLREANESIIEKQELIDTVTKEKEKFEKTAVENSIAKTTLQQRYNALEEQRDGLLTVAVQKKSLELELATEKQAKAAVDQEYTTLMSTSSGDAQQLARTKQELDQAQKEVAKLEEDKAATDILSGVLHSEKEALQTELNEKQEKWEQELQNRTSTIEQESHEHRQRADELAVQLGKSWENWSNALIAVLAADLTGDDLNPELLHPMLTPALSKINDFTPRESPEYWFAESYINPGPSPEVTPEDVTTVDLLRWSKNISTPLGLTNNDLDQLIWLESHLLNSIRKREKQGSPVFLSFQLLINKIKSEDWLTRCISCVRLAVLGNQYVMTDAETWSSLVGGLRDNHPQLVIDPLAQACFAYLALTTSHPSDHIRPIEPELVDAFEGALFSKTTPIPDILKLFQDNGVVSETVGDIELVMARFQHMDAVFSKNRSRRQWQCSLQPIKVEVLDVRLKLTWGPGSEHTVTFPYKGSTLYAYLHRHHGTTTMAAASAEARQRTIDLMNAALRRSSIDRNEGW